jgi:hypothetical protein
MPQQEMMMTLLARIVSGLMISCCPVLAIAQQHQGHHGVGHDTWHESFYSKLVRNDNKTSCCNLADCSPTTSRTIDGHYEVLVEGEWTRVPKAAIQNVTAPDGGAHVCAPKQQGIQKGTLYCVVLPPES